VSVYATSKEEPWSSSKSKDYVSGLGLRLALSAGDGRILIRCGEAWIFVLIRATTSNKQLEMKDKRRLVSAVRFNGSHATIQVRIITMRTELIRSQSIILVNIIS